MRRTRWIVQFADPEQFYTLPAELLALGTRERDDDGHPLLLLRDSLSAYKIASSSRGQVCRGVIVTGEERPRHATKLTGDAYLVLEQAENLLTA